MPSQSFVERIRQHEAAKQASFVKDAPPDHPVTVIAQGDELEKMRGKQTAVSVHKDGTVVKDPEHEPARFPLDGEENYDPRPELEDDHDLWCGLLEVAGVYDGLEQFGLYQTLHGLRCCGMRLVRRAAGGARLTRDSQTTITTDEYDATKEKFLKTHAAKLNTLLMELR